METALTDFSLDIPRERETALKQRLDSVIERLAHQLSEGQSQEFTELLKFYSRFWTYSVRNCLLIQHQCPHATRCAGHGLWKRLGYQIQKGQKAIWIWAPILERIVDPETGEERSTIVGFRSAAIFDFSQLVEAEEKPLPPILPALPDDHEEQYQLARSKVRALGIKVTESPLFDGAVGTSRGGHIRIASGLDSRNRLFVLIHELTHELWHHQDVAGGPVQSPAQLEFEAESVSFVVAAVMGLNHSGARDYLLHWQATPELLYRSLVTIQRMVRKVLTVLEISFDVPHTPEALVA